MQKDGEWQCDCSPSWVGDDCSVPLELECNDRKDNDNDGLVDCADSECCATKECQNNPLCFSSADPLDILLRKQPPSPTASFFQRMQFLIEEDSVQSYAHRQAFNDRLVTPLCLAPDSSRCVVFAIYLIACLVVRSQFMFAVRLK